MSYCRKGADSDVYVYPLTDKLARGEVICELCKFGGDHVAVNGCMMFFHLVHHVYAGHKVPQRAFERLIEELESTRK